MPGGKDMPLTVYGHQPPSPDRKIEILSRSAMASSLELTILALISSVVLVVNFRRKLKMVDNMKVRVEKMTAAVQNQSRYIRSLARGTLNLRRLHKNKIKIRDKTHIRCEEITELIKKATSVDCRLHVLDDRKTCNDNNWVAVVRHPDFRGSVLQSVLDEFDRQWKIGRRFIIWAVDRERAQEKVKLAYPAEKGFVMASFEMHAD